MVDRFETPECANPEDAARLIYKAQVDLSKPYVDVASVIVWENLALQGYKVTGMKSEKIKILQDLDLKAKQFEDLYNQAYEKLKDMYELCLGLQARREQP